MTKRVIGSFVNNELINKIIWYNHHSVLNNRTSPLGEAQFYRVKLLSPPSGGDAQREEGGLLWQHNNLNAVAWLEEFLHEGLQ